MSRQPIHLTQRGERVRDAVCAAFALVVIPAEFLILGKLLGF